MEDLGNNTNPEDIYLFQLNENLGEWGGQTNLQVFNKTPRSITVITPVSGTITRHFYNSFDLPLFYIIV